MSDPTPNENKVQFNLKNVHYSVITVASDGTITFGTPVAVPGAVTLNLSPAGNMEPFYADGIIYYVAQSNSGYTGSIEMARFPDAMKTAVWGMAADSNGVIVESASQKTKEVALLWQFDGDEEDEYFVAYRCFLGKPAIASQTNTQSKTPQTQSADITIMPLPSGANAGKIVARTSNTTPAATKTGWFSAVYTGPSL